MLSDSPSLKLMDVLKKAVSFLNSKAVENPRLNAELLLCQVLDISRLDLYLQFDRPLTNDERNRYKELLRRRGSYEPLQYILGETEFMSLRFKVSPHVLIPRPETEVLIEKVMDCMKDRPRTHLLDIGTGSGNIAVSLARYIKDTEVVASDISSDILSVARHNAEVNGVSNRIRFIQTEVSTDSLQKEFPASFDAVVSNPPYVALGEWDALPREIQRYEPRVALCDEGDGLTFYPVIAQKGQELLKTEGFLFVEVGDGQGDRVQSILEKAGYISVTIYPDLNGIKRVVSGKLKKKEILKGVKK
jgi:release factor glutamine methyltransferase